MKNFAAVLFVLLSLNAFSQIPDYVPTEGLVAWYPFSGNANDSSGNGFNGEVIGATLSTDRHGTPNSSYYFDWANVSGYGSAWHRIEVNPTFSDAIENTMSISAWINLENYWWPNNSIHSAMIAGSAARCPNPMNFRFKVFEQGQLGLNYGNNVVATEENVVELNVWHHVAATVGENSMKLYLDGIEVAHGEASYFDMTGCLTFGEHHQGNGHWYYFDGSIDDLSIHSRELGPDEILVMANELIPVEGCSDETACNYNPEANTDDGSCLVAGCTYPDACNFDPLAACDDGSCDYSCCPGPGCCSEGMYWDWELEGCYLLNAADINMDGCVQLGDLLDLLSAYGACEWQCGDLLTYQGYDYETVQIGEQCWFAENLRNAQYNNGDSIPTGLNDIQWVNAEFGAMTVYGQGSGFCGETSPLGDACDEIWSMSEYGLLYNWYAVIDGRGLCPAHWHVPSNTEWIELSTPLGGATVAGLHLKAAAGWAELGNGSDSFGFRGLPGGHRSRNNGGAFLGAGDIGYWWTTTSQGNYGIDRYLSATSDELGSATRQRADGFSVRCVKDAE